MRQLSTIDDIFWKPTRGFAKKRGDDEGYFVVTMPCFFTASMSPLALSLDSPTGAYDNLAWPSDLLHQQDCSPSLQTSASPDCPSTLCNKKRATGQPNVAVVHSFDHAVKPQLTRRWNWKDMASRLKVKATK